MRHARIQVDHDIGVVEDAVTQADILFGAAGIDSRSNVDAVFPSGRTRPRRCSEKLCEAWYQSMAIECHELQWLVDIEPSLRHRRCDLPPSPPFRKRRHTRQIAPEVRLGGIAEARSFVGKIARTGFLDPDQRGKTVASRSQRQVTPGE